MITAGKISITPIYSRDKIARYSRRRGDKYKNMKILIVEDDSTLRLALAVKLEQENFEVITGLKHAS